MRNDKIFGVLYLSFICHRPFLRLALIGALAAALGVAGCGRKGPLDPPPGASLAGEPQAAPAPGLISPNRGPTPIGGQAKDNNPGVDENGQPLAPKGPKKHIPLDVLLN
jgi:predicted small lipoprotein YifL